MIHWLKKVAGSFKLAICYYRKNQCLLHASALTFFSLLSIVPVLAMAFGIARGFGMDELLKKELMKSMQSQEEVTIKLITFAQNMLEKTSGGLIAGIGVLSLIWSVMKLLGNIENAFNYIWQVKEGRSWKQKITDYLSMSLAAPILFISGSAAALFALNTIGTVTSSVGVVQTKKLLVLLPYVSIWSLFTLTYNFMPNTRVQWPSALVGGVIGGTLYQFFQYGYLYFQVEIANYGAVYGSFAALPLFLIWLQCSWIVLLFGSEIAYQYQFYNIDGRFKTTSISDSLRKKLALTIVLKSTAHFKQGRIPLSREQLATHLKISIRALQPVLDQLVEANLLAVTYEGKLRHYQPCVDISTMTLDQLLVTFESVGQNQLPKNAQSEEFHLIDKKLIELHQVELESPKNLMIQDLIALLD